MKYLLLVYLARVMVYCQNVRRKKGGGREESFSKVTFTHVIIVFFIQQLCFTQNSTSPFWVFLLSRKALDNSNSLTPPPSPGPLPWINNTFFS